ncbi:hypothetical protein ABTX99_33090 [Streptomyces flaveolus]|uniref:hypothetical protein n=1 Tax=Streptomyces flaveolus TaxID=67297 RepID=UPI00331E19EE
MTTITLSDIEAVARPPGPPGRCREQCLLLGRRVFAHLGLALGGGQAEQPESATT